MSTQATRAWKAAALLVLALGACLAADAAMRPTPQAVQAMRGEGAQSIWEGESSQDYATSLFARLANPPDASREIPAAIEQEVLAGMDGASDCVVSGSTVGLVVQASTEEAEHMVLQRLESLGWVRVGQDALPTTQGRTLIKDSGVYRWLFMQVADVGGSSSVVLSLMGGQDG